MFMASTFRTLGALAALVTLTACTVHKQDAAPPLTGPSDNATTLSITVTPDVLTQDGVSQSLVAVQAFGPNGQPQRSLPIRGEIAVGGAITDFGSLSARNVVTDASGRATFTYTAPPAPPFNNDIGTTVQIVVTPQNNGDYSNANSRNATIRLVPGGVVGPPPSSLRADFVPPPGVTIGNPAIFTATVVDSTNADASAQVVSYHWNFGDGDTATGRSATHVYDDPGNFSASLVIVDVLGRTSIPTFRTVTVGQGQLPVASIVMSPSGPGVGQTVFFDGSGSTAEAGHRIVDYSWNFGDGSGASGPSVTHSYPSAGAYTVSLRVTDDAGRVSAVASQVVNVGQNLPTASFTFSPTSPVATQPVSFNGSQSRAANGRTIASYSWDFGDGTSGNGVQTTHAYVIPGTYTVTLTVTDDVGQTGFASKEVTVQNDAPTARFTITPPTPTAASGTDVDVILDASTSTAASGRTIVAYNWNVSGTNTFSFPGGASGVVIPLRLRSPGAYSITLTVTDNAGKTHAVTQNVAVTVPSPIR
jgi:PKD repeat protein